MGRFLNAPGGPPETVGQALQVCSTALGDADLYFGHGTDNPWDEAVQLVLAVADLPQDAGDGVLPHPLGDQQAARLENLLRRRIEERLPLPYLLGRAWFAGLEFHCDARAIIPRSPLAELLRCGFEPWYRGPEPRRVLDLCCGGGCIGLATAVYLPGVQVDLVDIDPGALDLAAENTALHGLQGRVEILHSDLLAAVRGRRYDLILCNPPYVNAPDLAAMPAEFLAEPPGALQAGRDGLDFAHRVLAGAGELLEEHGLLLLELGHSWPALERAYPRVPFTWVEFECGGEGVLALTAREWQQYSESWRR